MSAAAYFPTHGSLEERVVEWLRKNPDEELQRSDVASKFQVAQTAVASGLAWAVARGELAWVKPADGVPGVYRLGDGMPRVQTPPPPPAPAPAPMRKAGAIKASAKAFGKTLGDEALDISVQVTEARHLTVAFVLPPEADAHLVAAAMLTAAAHSMERIQVAAPKP